MCSNNSISSRYRYSDEEIPKLLSNLSSWVDELNTWQLKVAEVYKNGSEKEGVFFYFYQLTVTFFLNSNFILLTYILPSL